MQTWPLTGRAEELKIIAGAVCPDEPHAGVVIAGSPGVGKTRLAREAAAIAADRGWVVRWAAGTVAAQSVPLGALAQWADRFEGNPLQLVGGVIATMTASPERAPVLVIVDDARLLDNLSAFVIHQVVLRRSASVLVTIRTGGAAPDAITALWKDGHLRRLDLQPLSRGESDTLLTAVLDGPVDTACAERMWRLTHGNVLFLRQLVTQESQAARLVSHDGTWQWTGTMEPSESLIDLVDLRIGTTPEPVLEVIDLVAVAEPLELAYLTSLVDVASIEEAEHRGLVTVSRAVPTALVRLGHPLYGEVRLAQAGHVRLERLRGRIASTMSAPDSTVGKLDSVRLALLWLQSDLSPNHELFTTAAQAAFIRLDMELAQRLAKAAVDAGGGVEAELLCANTLMTLCRGEEAEDLLKSLTGQTLPEPAWSTAVSVRADNLLWVLGQPERARRVVDEALASATGSLTHRLLALRAVQLAVEAHPAEALAVCGSIDCHDLGALPASKLASAQCIAFGDTGQPEQAARAVEAARLDTAAPEAAFQSIIVIVYYAQALTLAGCLPEALAVADRYYQECPDVPGPAQSFAAAISGIAALGVGDLDTAIERLHIAIDGFTDRTDGGWYHFGIYYVEALARKGDLDAASELLAQVQRSRHPAHVYRESDTLLAAAWVAAAYGRTSQARELAGAAAEFARTHGQHARELVSLQAAIQFGDQHTADRLAELVELVSGPRAGLVARWATALSDHDGDGLLAASGDLETMGDRIAAADAAAHAARIFLQQNRRGPALTASGRAERLITDCGAVTPATQAAAMPLPLTEREREIAGLISQGLSNAEVAQALTLSVRTIEGHIYRACARVGAATRTELARLVAEFGSAHNS
jgi:DNA-binding CsgD family transcriptional regulator